jgi:uncharacterized membrane protein
MNFFLHFLNRIPAEKFFVVAAFFFGILILFITPPFQVPDEPNHFYRTWQVAEGGLISVKMDKRVGGFLPSSLEKVVQPFYHIVYARDAKLQDVGINDLLKIPLNNVEKKFYDFNNTAMYSPVCYLPGAIAIFISKNLNTPPLYSFYVARLFNLLFWMLLVYSSIKIIPFHKWLFTFLGLLPMSLFVNMSLSADVVTNGICFLFIATVLKYAYGDFEVKAKHFVYLCLIIFFLMAVKSTYSPLALLLLLVPKNRFRGAYSYLNQCLFLVCVGPLTFMLWSSLLNPLYISYENYNLNYREAAELVNGADMHRQIQYIMHHGSYFFKVLTGSFASAFDMYFKGYIGVFGWLDTPLPLWLIYSSYGLILLLTIGSGQKNIRVTWLAKSIIALTFAIILFLVFLSQHLIWDVVGGDFIMNIQGRYLIPFTPLLFLLFYRSQYEKLKVLAPISIIFSVICLFVSLHVIYNRYY